jgi:hypothetical protein
MRHLILIFIFFGIFSLSWKKPLDPNSRPHAFLSKYADALDKINIDIMNDWRSNVQVGNRPVIAPLANYPVLWNENGFKEEVKTGELKILFFINTLDKIDNTKSEFDKKWYSVSKDKRIFISFARENAETAKAFADLLNKTDHIPFIYITNEKENPKQSIEKVAEYLRTAGTAVVVDTPIARTKKGVFAEALAEAEYKSRKLTDGEIITARAKRIEKYKKSLKKIEEKYSRRENKKLL